MDRRTLLRRATVLGAVALAGCTSDDPSGDGTTDGDTPGEGTTTATATATATREPTVAATADGTTAQSGGPTTATAERPTDTPSPTTTSAPTATATPDTPQESVTVTVGANGRARFSPESFTLAEGGTVTWEWAGGGHNVVPERQPDGADWTGSPGGASTTHDRGYTYEATFDTAGEYEYYCSPHRGIGMTGSFTVE